MHTMIEFDDFYYMFPAKYRFIAKIKEMKNWLRTVRNQQKAKEWWETLKSKLRGHYQYYGVNGNFHSIERFYYLTLKLVFKWINRRSDRKSMEWDAFNEYIKRVPLPKPKLCHKRYLENNASDYYNTYRLKELVDTLVENYGVERSMYLIARTVQYKGSYDGRFCKPARTKQMHQRFTSASSMGIQILKTKMFTIWPMAFPQVLMRLPLSEADLLALLAATGAA